jgi:hypothetical protein
VTKHKTLHYAVFLQIAPSSKYSQQYALEQPWSIFYLSVEDGISHSYNTTPEILGIDISNTQMFVCFNSLVLELDIETTVFLYVDLAGL